MPVHIYLDPSLEADCDYSELFLWMVDEIAKQFSKNGHPVDDAALGKVVGWFAERTKIETTDLKKEIGLSAEAEGLVQDGNPRHLFLQAARTLKSMIVGSQSSRKEVRQKVQDYATELRERMNEFLDRARDVLRRGQARTAC